MPLAPPVMSTRLSRKPRTLLKDIKAVSRIAT
jgi:hypothetical protein